MLEDLKTQLNDISVEEENPLIGQRLTEIRLELKAKGVLSKSDIAELVGVSENSLWRAEKGNNISYFVLLKLINLYKLLGYNPLWILTKNNIFIEKHENESDVLLNKTSVSSASKELIESIENQLTTIKESIEVFKGRIKG